MDAVGAVELSGGQQLNRIEPGLGPEHYKSYQIAAPVRTHWRPSTCEEVGCVQFHSGFELVIDESSALGQFQAGYVRDDRSRSCREEKRPDGMTVFTYPPGTRCFRQHTARLDRMENFLITGGDWRGNPRGDAPVRLRSDDWVDSFANHQIRIREVQERG